MTGPDQPAGENPSPADLRKAKQAKYVEAGRLAIMQMVDQDSAVLWGEIISRAADRQWPGVPFKVHPHILLSSLGSLIPNRVTPISAATRGGRVITVFQPTSPNGRKTQIERAAARKRLLDTRYTSWASGSSTGTTSQGVIGLAAERVVHESLRTASPEVGYRLLNPERGNVGRPFDVEIPGALDNAAVFVLPKDQTRYLMAVEVTSLRQWVYPANKKVYQLLLKAAMLSTSLSDLALLPVLVCRRAHTTTFRMARDLGFHVIETNGTQWLPRISTINEAAVQEVRAELGYVDLRFLEGANPYLVKQFSTVIPATARERAKRWRQIGSRFSDLYSSLRGRLKDDQVIAGRDLNVLRKRAAAALADLPREDLGDSRNGGW